MSRRGSDARTRLGVALLAFLALGPIACAGDGDAVATSTATTAAVGDFVFGSGSIPPGFPADFPIPEAATVGSTLVDKAEGRFEVLLFVPADQDATIVYYETNLPSAGYTITASGFDGAVWRLEFANDGASGGAVIRLENTGIATVAIDLTIG